MDVTIGDKTHDFTQEQISSLVDDLRQSVAAYRDTDVDFFERTDIMLWWDKLGVKNQFHAMTTAAALEKLEV